MDLHNKNILFGVTGGIAAYKSAIIVRLLKKLKANVHVVMTKSSQKFITPLTLATLSEQEVGLDLFDQQPLSEMLHIEWAEWADIMLIAPATANCLGKLAHGIADDLLSNLVLAAQCPVFIAPAMHHQMWSHPAVQNNIKILKTYSYHIIDPVEGELASGDTGVGRMREPDDIIKFLQDF